MWGVQRAACGLAVRQPGSSALGTPGACLEPRRRPAARLRNVLLPGTKCTSEAPAVLINLLMAGTCEGHVSLVIRIYTAHAALQRGQLNSISTFKVPARLRSQVPAVQKGPRSWPHAAQWWALAVTHSKFS